MNATRMYHHAGVLRLHAARDLLGVSQVVATRPLYQQGTLLLARAFLASRGRDVADDRPILESVLKELENAFLDEQIQPPADFVRGKALLLSTDPLELDRLPAQTANRKIEELETATRWLATLVDTRSPKQVKLTRILRMTTAVALVALLLVWVAVKVFSPKNYALDRPARSSSVAFATSPDGANDGSKNGTFGFHSIEEEMPWWTVDMGKSIAVGEIRVFGRGDCCYDQSIPLALEASDDGTTFRKIAERTEPFSESNPWVIKPDELFTRFIRLRTQRRSFLVLSEVEVYARKSR